MVRLLREENQGAGGPPRNPPRNYFSRPVQYQLLALVFALMLVLVLMQEAAKPKNWAWLWAGADAAAAVDTLADETADRVASESEPIDTRLAPARHGSWPPDSIQVPANLPQPSVGHPDEEGYLPGIDPERLRVVRDDTMFERGETTVWYELLERLASFDSADWDAQTPLPVGFAQLYRQPDVYRGKLVEVSGTIYRATYVESAQPSASVPGYWQVWLRPDGTNQVVVVYSLEMPAGFPTGTELREDARIAGIFFKRWAYLAQDGPRSAPLVLARMPRWTPSNVQSTGRELPDWTTAILAVVGVGIAASMVAWWTIRQSRGPSAAATVGWRHGIGTTAIAEADAGKLPIGPRGNHGAGDAAQPARGDGEPAS